MTPAREQLETVRFEAELVSRYADRLRLFPEHAECREWLNRMWTSYFALDKALHDTGTEPPQLTQRAYPPNAWHKPGPEDA